MNWETHLTLKVGQPESLEVARTWATANRLKWTEILLETGQSPLQPMVTFWGNGTLESQLLRGKHIGQELDRLGCELIRVKVEADTAEWAIQHPETSPMPLYLEIHIKLRLPPWQDLANLQELIAPLGGKLSRNARRVLPGGAHERFITLRDHSCDIQAAGANSEVLVEKLRYAGHEVNEVESEVVVFDSNLALDSGWR